jgi:hypothetical protein
MRAYLNCSRLDQSSLQSRDLLRFPIAGCLAQAVIDLDRTEHRVEAIAMVPVGNSAKTSPILGPDPDFRKLPYSSLMEFYPVRPPAVGERHAVDGDRDTALVLGQALDGCLTGEGFGIDGADRRAAGSKNLHGPSVPREVRECSGDRA